MIPHFDFHLADDEYEVYRIEDDVIVCRIPVSYTRRYGEESARAWAKFVTDAVNEHWEYLRKKKPKDGE